MRASRRYSWVTSDSVKMTSFDAPCPAFARVATNSMALSSERNRPSSCTSAFARVTKDSTRVTSELTSTFSAGAA